MTKGWATKGERVALEKETQKLIRDTWSSPNRTNFMIGWQSYITKEKDARKSSSAILRFLESKGIGERNRAFLSLAIYLFLAEGAYASYMNFVCFMLVSQGHDLYNVFKRRFACSFKEIEGVNLETKEQFLKEHRLDLFKKGLNRKLRNAIAHYDFKIEDDGTISVKGEIIDINYELEQLLDFMSFLHGATAKAFKQIQPRKPHSKTKRKRDNQ